MANELVRAKENAFNPPNTVRSTGAESIAKVFGGIADKSLAKATEYAAEASKTNLLQTNAMLKDVEVNSKLEMLKSPNHAEAIAKNAAATAERIKANASLNRQDRVSLDLAAKDTVRELGYQAAVKSIGNTNAQAKYATLSTFNSTLQGIKDDIFLHPELADKNIEAVYSSLSGQVQAGILTPVEAAALHKQLEMQVRVAHELVKGVNSGVITVSDLNAIHSASPIQTPLSNAHLPIEHDTQFHAENYSNQLTAKDIRVKYDSGQSVNSENYANLKTVAEIDNMFNYAAGSHHADGDLQSLKMWPDLRNKLAELKKIGSKSLSTFQEAYKNRLNYFFATIDQPGAYQKYIDLSPEGARALEAYNSRNIVIENSTPFGTPETTAQVKYDKHVDSLNQLVSDRKAAGIGADVPDYLNQPIDLGYLKPVESGFQKDGDVNAAIANIHLFNKENRVSIMNHFRDNPRQAMTVYEIGNLENKASPGYLIDLFKSQQVDALGVKASTKKDAQEKFKQLAKGTEEDRSAFSDEKLRARIETAIEPVLSYLNKQPDPGKITSSKIDQALRYIKYKAADSGDYNFEHLNDYLQTYAANNQAAYGAMTGVNYVTNSHDLPLEDYEVQVLASHALNFTRNKLLEYKTPKQVDDIFSNTPPILVSSPGGRVAVIYPNNTNVVDKNGRPAYSHLFNERLWRHAEADKNITEYKEQQIKDTDLGFLPVSYGSPVVYNQGKLPKYIRGAVEKSKVVRPLVEGNIDVDKLPKVYDKKGNWQTVNTITREFDGKTVLLPTIINGKQVSVKEATEHYLKTGQHLGIFNTKEQADVYDEHLHLRHNWIGAKNKWNKK